MAVAWKSFSSGDGYVSGAYAIELGMLRSGWSVYEEVSIKYDKGRPGTGVTVIEQNWEDVVDYKIGGFYTFTDYLKIVVAITKQPVRFRRRHLPQRHQMVLGATALSGAGYKRRAFLMDLAYLMSDFLPSETRTNQI